jgi:hypothetical protein
MPRNNQGNRSSSNNRGGSSENRSNRSNSGVMEIARDRPFTAAVTAAAAVGAGVFLWSRRNQISEQISNLSDQFGEWSQNMGSNSSGSFDASDDTGGFSTGGAGGSGFSGGMSETGGGNASLGATTGGGGSAGTGSASGRGRVRQSPTS